MFPYRSTLTKTFSIGIPAYLAVAWMIRTFAWCGTRMSMSSAVNPAFCRAWSQPSAIERTALLKISLPCIELWGRILRRLPDARLILKYKGMDDPAEATRLHGLFALQGIAPFHSLERMQAIQLDDLVERRQSHFVDDAFAAAVVERG